jgi:gag-polypeptide of LTR copia-type
MAKWDPVTAKCGDPRESTPHLDINDQSLRAVILSHVSDYDYESVSHLPTSHAVFEELRKTHEQSQMILVKKAMEMRFRPDVPLSKTVEEIDALHFKIVNMGPIDNDQLKAVFLLNALNDNFEDIHYHLMSMADDPSFSSKTIIRRLRQEDSLMRRRAEQNSQTLSITFAAQGRGRPRPACTNCKKLGHLADFCVQPGGKMAGRSIEEARTAQRAFANKQSPTKQQ